MKTNNLLPIELFIAKQKSVIHGRKALNKQLPEFLHRKTIDWDLWDKTPKKEANLLQQFLDNQVGQDRFYVSEPIKLTGSNKKVYRVIDRVTRQEVADFIKVPTYNRYAKKIGEIKYETLAHAKKIYKMILSNSKYKHRWAKATRDLSDIEKFEALQKIR